jgi:hypothetical protein
MKSTFSALTTLLMSLHLLQGQTITYPNEIPAEPAKILYQLDIYQDSSTMTVFQQVIRTDSVGKSELKKRFKNWGGKTFVNFSEVLVSETEDQIVMVYIVDIPGRDGIGKWYVRMIANFKDDRVRISLLDDGNVYIPPSQYSPGAAARTYNLTIYFKRFGNIDPEKNTMMRKSFSGVVSWYNKILSTLTSCGNALTQPATTNTDDW